MTLTNREAYELARRVLTDKQFDVWRLVVYDGRAKREAARVLGINRRTLDGHLEAADDRMREAMAP